MRYPLAAAAVLTFALGGAAVAQNESPPDNLGKAPVAAPTGGATLDAGRSTIVAPAEAPVVVTPVDPRSPADMTTGAAPSGAKPGVSGVGNQSQ